MDRASIEYVVAISTVDETELSSHGFERLLASAQNVVDRVVLVVRGRIAREGVETLDRMPKPQITVLYSNVIGVSSARNRGLLWLYSNLKVPWERTAVVFPDPDAWFNSLSRSRIQASLESGGSDLAIGPYAPSDGEVLRSRWPIEIGPIEPRLLLSLVASAGIVFRMSTIAQNGLFDERLGVGAPAGAAEDVEIVIRSFKSGSQVSYFHMPFMYHPYKPPRHGRVLGGVAIVYGYGQYFPSRIKATYLLRSLIDRTRTFPRLTPGIALSALRIARSFEPINPEGCREKVSVGELEVTKLAPPALLPEIAREYLSGQYVTVFGAHVTSLNARRDRCFSQAFNQADFAIVDGVSVALAARLARGVRLEKLATTDYAVALLQILTTVLGRSPRIAIIGGEAGVAEAAGNELEAALSLDVVAHLHGYQNNMRAALESIRDARPEVLIVGMGMPLEATEVAVWGADSSARLVITCGGWLRLLAGEEKRAPRFWQVVQLEWLWRLLTDPRRTARRYVEGAISVVAVAFGARR